jgi:hypothetical protein
MSVKRLNSERSQVQQGLFIIIERLTHMCSLVRTEPLPDKKKARSVAAAGLFG